MGTPNGETVRWARESQAAGADLVEVELGYWLEAARRNPATRLGVSLVVSDVLQGENHRDMTQWSWSDAADSREALREAVAGALGLEDPEDLRIRSFETKPLMG